MATDRPHRSRWEAKAIHRISSLIALVSCACLAAAAAVAAPAQRVPTSPSLDARDHEAAPPVVLSDRDMDLYLEIFRLQEKGDWARAKKHIGALKNPVLLGHVEAQKFLHPTKYRSRYPELLKWLRSYGDHPQARRLYRLAMKRHIKGWKYPPKPNGKMLSGNGPRQVDKSVRNYRSSRKRSAATARAVSRFRAQIRRLIRRGWPTGAYRKLRTPRARKLLDRAEFAIARAEIAHGYFVFGKDELAMTLAEKSMSESVESIPIAAWTGGLAAWRQGELDRAGAHFEALAAWLHAEPSARAAGAFWASRVHLAQRRPREATKWLAQAATVPGTFYGLLGRRALGIDMPLDWSLPRLTQAIVERLLAVPGGRRAFALLQLGMRREAERELRGLFWTLPDPLRPALMTLAATAGMPGLSMRAAGVLKAEGHRPYYAALFPIPGWEISAETDVDPSLIYAVARQESHFDPRAKSSRGARGLMQLMPRTAAFVGENRAFRGRSGRNALYDPQTNLKLGGQYIRHLMQHKGVGGDLFKMLAAYNAGPGTLRKWERLVNYKQDPLFFIEAIPSRETRNFIENVLRNLWMYRLRRDEPAPSLDRVAAGSWPRYESVDGQRAQRFSHARN